MRVFRLSCLSLLTPLPLYLLLWVDFHSFLQVCLAISVMLQNFMICLEIKTLVLDMWLCTSRMIFPFLLNSCCCFLRLCLVITLCRKVRVTLLFSDSSLLWCGCYTSLCVWLSCPVRLWATESQGERIYLWPLHNSLFPQNILIVQSNYQHN